MLKKFTAIFILFVLTSTTVSAAEEVNVGGYIFPPFVEKDEKGKISGMTVDLIDALNKIQSDFTFKLVLTSSRRRYVAFEQGQFDALFFESLVWGWENTPIDSSKVFLKGGEVFIALASKAKNQNFFKNLKDKSISAMLGYHYQFAGFNADPDYLRSHYNIHLSSNEKTNIQLVLAGQMDVAIVTKSFLDRFVQDTPDAKAKLIVSDKLDQEYNHTVLLRKDINLSVEKMNQLIDKLTQSGEYFKILDKYGIKH